MVGINENKLTKVAKEKEEKYQKLVQQYEEENNLVEEEGSDDESIVFEGKNWNDWFAEAQFYIFGGAYMFARIAMNVTAVFVPLYIALITTPMENEREEPADTNFQVATVPLISYTSSLLWSLFG